MQRLGTTALVLCTKSTLCPSFFLLQRSPRLLCINQFLIAVTPLLTKADPTFPNCTLDLMSGPVFFLSFLGNPYPLIRRVYFSSYLTGFILSGLDCFLDCTPSEPVLILLKICKKRHHMLNVKILKAVYTNWTKLRDYFWCWHMFWDCFWPLVLWYITSTKRHCCILCILCISTVFRVECNDIPFEEHPFQSMCKVKNRDIIS